MSLFRRGPERSEVEAQLENVRGVVSILGLSRANLSVPESLLREAEASLARNDTIRAMDACGRAERIATSLEADYKAATETVATLKTQIERMKALGMSVEDTEEALQAIHASATSMRELDGSSVPDYAGARALAADATARADTRLALADRASTGIFAAEMAIEGAAETFGKGPVDALREPRELLEKARAELAGGNLELAATDAGVAETLALGSLDRRRQAQETLASVERITGGLRSVGISVNAVTRSLDLGRALLAKGRLSAAVDVFNEAAQEAVQIGQKYRYVLDALSAAQKVLDALRAEGLPLEEAESSLARAKAALKAGNYGLAATCAEDVQAAARRQREARESLREQIAATRQQANRLREMGLAFANDVDEMVGRAEREFENGDFAGTSEDLRIASLLMNSSAKPNGKESPAVFR